MPTESAFIPLVRQVGVEFLSWYQGLGYQQLEGSSLLTDSLPMTFVMSAGMVQFELLAEQKRDSDKFVLIQRCFRHFDIEKVGNSDYHLSLFHMPGAFRFGPVDRKQTIMELWTLLTEVYHFPLESLAVTYFQGGEVHGSLVPEDTETARAWEIIGMPSERIFGLPPEENFWKQSAHMVGIVNSRKCGPNTEVFYDRGEEYACGPNCQPGCSCGRYIEFSNTLFIEYRFDDTGNLRHLEEPFTEIVIGQERVAMLLENVPSVYAIETVFPLVQQVRCFSTPGLLAEEEITHYERILADHLRALLYLTLDGAPPPGRGGRARLMRILVREFLTAQEMLGITDITFLPSMLYVTNDLYPETRRVWRKVQRYIREEEIRFQETLQKGMRKLEQHVKTKRGIRGEEILKYEKKHGIPFVLLTYRLRQKGIHLSQKEYAVYRKAKVALSSRISE